MNATIHRRTTYTLGVLSYFQVKRMDRYQMRQNLNNQVSHTGKKSK